MNYADHTRCLICGHEWTDGWIELRIEPSDDIEGDEDPWVCSWPCAATYSLQVAAECKDDAQLQGQVRRTEQEAESWVPGVPV